jgi:hypothetical protein
MNRESGFLCQISPLINTSLKRPFTPIFSIIPCTLHSRNSYRGTAEMAIVYQRDTRPGITYAYESKSFWDKKKKQSRPKRTLIGRVDTESGSIVPTDGRIRKKREKALGSEGVPLPDRYFFGATYLLDQISKEVGLIDDLKTCFPQHHTQILSIAYFMILEGHSPLSRFGKWARFLWDWL